MPVASGAYANYRLFLIILVGYCSGKHTVNYGTIGAYEAFVFGNDGWTVGGVW